MASSTYQVQEWESQAVISPVEPAGLVQSVSKVRQTTHVKQQTWLIYSQKYIVTALSSQICPGKLDLII